MRALPDEGTLRVPQPYEEAKQKNSIRQEDFIVYLPVARLLGNMAKKLSL